jgi:hypothetical protein
VFKAAERNEKQPAEVDLFLADVDQFLAEAIFSWKAPGATSAGTPAHLQARVGPVAWPHETADGFCHEYAFLEFAMNEEQANAFPELNWCIQYPAHHQS